MDIGLHHCSERLVDAPMTGQRCQAGENFAGYFHREVTSPIAGAVVAGMLVAFIDDQQRRWPQHFQRGANPLYALAVDAQGNTNRKGLTSTLA